MQGLAYIGNVAQPLGNGLCRARGGGKSLLFGGEGMRG